MSLPWNHPPNSNWNVNVGGCVYAYFILQTPITRDLRMKTDGLNIMTTQTHKQALQFTDVWVQIGLRFNGVTRHGVRAHAFQPTSIICVHMILIAVTLHDRRICLTD